MNVFAQLLDAWRVARGEPVTGHPEPPRDPLALELDEEGWLHGDQVELWPSVRHSGLLGGEPRGIVWHYTAVKPGTPLWKRIVTYRRGVDRAASWHLIIEADGRLYQSVSFQRAAWHCSAGLVAGHRPNLTTVGIELASLDGKVWPAPQVAAAGRVLRALADRYPITRGDAGHAHSALDPARRSDPGRPWMDDVLPGLLEQAFGAERVA